VPIYPKHNQCVVSKKQCPVRPCIQLSTTHGLAASSRPDVGAAIRSVPRAMKTVPRLLPGGGSTSMSTRTSLPYRRHGMHSGSSTRVGAGASPSSKMSVEPAARGQTVSGGSSRSRGKQEREK